MEDWVTEKAWRRPGPPVVAAARQGIPAGVWILGFVSMLMDISSEMIHALLPVYMVTVLGTSALAVGIIEGIAEATASITKVFSGALSDWLGKRKPWPRSAMAWRLLPSRSLHWRFRSNGSSPRASSTVSAKASAALRAMPSSPTLRRPHLRGASFGLRQSLDTVGAFLDRFSPSA